MDNVNAHLLRDLDEACARAKRMAATLDDNGIDYVTIQVGEVLVSVRRMRKRTGVINIHIYHHPSADADANVVHEVEYVSSADMPADAAEAPAT